MTFRVLRLIIIIIIRAPELLPDAHFLQVCPCFRPIFGPLWHVEQGTKQTLAHVLRDMHDIKAVRHTEDLPVWKSEKTDLFSIHSAAALAPFDSFPAVGTLSNF